MLKKILCFLLGHKIVIKHYLPVTGRYIYEKSSFCLRCGKDNKNTYSKNIQLED